MMVELIHNLLFIIDWSEIHESENCSFRDKGDN